MARPTKLTDNFLRVANKILSRDINCVILTDDELLFLINDELPENERIGESTFEGWKRESKNNEFSRLIKKTRIKQKIGLIKSMDENKLWTQKAWILERKFTEFNLKQLSEVQHKVEPITINLNLK